MHKNPPNIILLESVINITKILEALGITKGEKKQGQLDTVFSAFSLEFVDINIFQLLFTVCPVTDRNKLHCYRLGKKPLPNPGA